MLAMRTLLEYMDSWSNLWGIDSLFRVVSGIAVEPGEDTAGNSIRELDEDSIPVYLRKPALEDELNDCMV